MSQIVLPDNYPISKTFISKLRGLQPASKTLYKEKYVTSVVKEIHDSLKEKIFIKLKIAAQKFNLDLITQEEYIKYKDELFKFIVNETWVDGLYDALAEMYSSIDAFSLLETTILESTHEEITIDNLAEFIGENPDKNTISLIQTYKENFNSNKLKYETKTQQDSENLIAETKQIIFVTVYPERPIPSNLMLDDEEDDLEVEGGKVDLTCPISRTIFENPVKNKNCIHTYDLDALHVYLRRAKICPECRASLSSTSYTPDIIMQARVDAYKRDQQLNELIQDKIVDETDKL